MRHGLWSGAELVEEVLAERGPGAVASEAEVRPGAPVSRRWRGAGR